MLSQDIQKAIATVNVKVHASTLKKRLHKFDLHDRSFAMRPPRQRPGYLEQCALDRLI